MDNFILFIIWLSEESLQFINWNCIFATHYVTMITVIILKMFSAVHVSTNWIYRLLSKASTKILICLIGTKLLRELLNKGFWNLCCTSTNLYLVLFVLLFELAIHIWVHYCKNLHIFSDYLKKEVLFVDNNSCFIILPLQMGGLCSLDRSSVGPRQRFNDLDLSWWTAFISRSLTSQNKLAE